LTDVGAAGDVVETLVDELHRGLGVDLVDLGGVEIQPVAALDVVKDDKLARIGLGRGPRRAQQAADRRDRRRYEGSRLEHAPTTKLPALDRADGLGPMLLCHACPLLSPAGGLPGIGLRRTDRVGRRLHDNAFARRPFSPVFAPVPFRLRRS
jgi:hypothetical protein